MRRGLCGDHVRSEMACPAQRPAPSCLLLREVDLLELRQHPDRRAACAGRRQQPPGQLPQAIWALSIHAANTDSTQQSGTQESTRGLNRMAHLSRQFQTSLPVPEDAFLRQLR